KKIMDESGKNLVFTPGLENKPITFYTKHTSFEAAMDKMALANNLILNKTKDGFFVFEDANSNPNQNLSYGKSLNFEILDPENKLLKVNFSNAPIIDIVNQIGSELNINIFTASPLDNAGTI